MSDPTQATRAGWGAVRKRSNTGVITYGAVNGLGHGGAMTGGPMNAMTGMGTSLDSNEHTTWLPTRFLTRQTLETIYVQSWAARKFIDIPVDDMTIRWRTFEASEDVTIEQIKMFQDAERELKVRDAVIKGMKAGRKYGTAVIVIVTEGEDLATPLDIQSIRPGSVLNLLVLDRYDLSVAEYDGNVMSRTYGQPLTYSIAPRFGNPVPRCDASRVIRFDGIMPLTNSSFTMYEQWWGVSCLVPVMLSIAQDQSIATSVAHLAKEASIPYIKLAGFQDAIAGQVDEHELSVEQLAQRLNQLRSNFRTLFLSEADEFGRESVTWSGIPDVMDRFAQRIAAAADIPATRFWGQSPIGMNATGDSDMQNYAIRVNALQELLLCDPLYILDQVVLRHAGIEADEPFEYSWPSLIDVSDLDQATADLARVQALGEAADRAALMENEFRERLNNIEFFGDLEELDDATLAAQRQFNNPAAFPDPNPPDDPPSNDD